MEASSATTRLSLLLLTLLLLLSFLPTPSSSSSRYLAAKSVLRCNPHDYSVLMKMKASLHNPQSLSSWLPNTNCCNWTGLYCNPKISRIYEFAISGFDDFSFLPAELGDLPYLNNIYIEYYYNLSGTIPSTIAKLKNLRILVLNSNNLSGPIPSFLSPKLYILDLSFNQFSGSIPSSLSSLSKLTTLSLNNNRLTGAIPESFGKFKQPSFSLDLSYNKLSGVIPKSLADVDFHLINLSGNKLEGDASMLFKANSSTLFSIDLSRNRFEFNLSKVGIPKNLNLFDISHNKIFGSIPEGITGLDQLFQLNVSYNGLCGKIPQGGEVQYFDSYSFFHNKCLCGSPLAACT